MYTEALKYAGNPYSNGTEIPICTAMLEGSNCTILNAMFETPSTVLSECGCHEKCDSYRFHVVGQQTVRYNVGNEANFLECSARLSTKLIFY